MNIFPLWCDRQARIKASFIQILIVHRRPGRSLGFDINGMWNWGISHIRRPAISSMIWLSVKLFLLINNVSRLLLCRDHLYTNRPHKPVCPSKTFKKLQRILVFWYCKVTLSVCSLVKGKQIWGGIVHQPLLVCHCKFTMTT